MASEPKVFHSELLVRYLGANTKGTLWSDAKTVPPAYDHDKVKFTSLGKPKLLTRRQGRVLLPSRAVCFESSTPSMV